MSSPISFTNDRNVNLLDLGGTEVLFSYDATVAFIHPETRQRYLNPRYTGYSKTTSKHLNAYGFTKGASIECDSERHFNAYLADALVIGAKRAQDEVCALLAS